MEYNRLKKALKEQAANSSYTDVDGGSSLTSGSYAPFQVEKPEVLNQINTFLKAFSLERYEDPKNALVLLRTKLNTLGLDFPYDGRRPLSPKEVFYLTQFGGRQGMNDKGEYFTDCGITNRTGGKSLELHVEISSINPDGTAMGPYYILGKLQYGNGMSVTTKDLEPGTSIAADSLKKKVTEEKDACYYTVKASYDVFPSAYASGQISQCRKGKGWAAKKARKKHKRHKKHKKD